MKSLDDGELVATSEGLGSQFLNEMLEAMQIPPELIAGTRRAGHSESLVFHHERLFKSMDDPGVHAFFDGA